ncbi:MAG: hypothetical protein WDO06_00130 [Actinomycetota bacterium]
MLWEIWDNALNVDGEKISESWRHQALRGGLRGALADRDLDAMMQLLKKRGDSQKDFLIQKFKVLFDKSRKKIFSATSLLRRDREPML